MGDRVDKIVAVMEKQAEEPTDALARRLCDLEDEHPDDYNEAERQLNGIVAATATADEGVETDPSTGEHKPRKWSDWLDGNETAQRVRLFKPADTAEVVAALATDAKAGVRVRSSRHADTPVGQPTDRMIDLTRMDRPLATDADAGTVTVQGGMKIRELNAFLAANGLSLPTMGSFDGQTLPGALCTGTHGSFTKMGPLAEAIVAAEVVTPDGRVLNLAAGDPLLDACAVGLGLSGVMTSLTLKVRPAFTLREQRWTTTWEDLRSDLVSVVNTAKYSDRVEVLVNPFRTIGERWDTNRGFGHTALVTERYDEGPWLPGSKPSWVNRCRHSLLAVAKVMPTWFVRVLVGNERGKIPATIDRALKLLTTAVPRGPMRSNVARADQILILGAGKKAHGFEVAVPLKRAAEVVDHILDVTAAEAADSNGFMLLNPFDLRFVKATDLPLAMQNRFDNAGKEVATWCMIEIPRLVHAKNQIDGRHSRIPEYVIEKVLEVGGRPHWGQFNLLESLRWKGQPVTADDLYPATIGAWRKARVKLDPKGQMLNAVTKRLKLG